MAKKAIVDDNHRYIIIECCLIPYINKETGPILSYGIVRYAQSITGDNYQVMASAIELFFENKLPSHITKIFTDAGITTINRNAGELHSWEITTVADQLLSALCNSSEPVSFEKFIDHCRPYYQINTALKKFKLNISAFTPMQDNYKHINTIVAKHERLHGKDAPVSIKIDTLLQYRDDDKSYRDFELLKGLLAIKSIQGKKDFAGTNKPFITARMIGAKNAAVAECLVKDKALKKLHSRYNERYFFDMLIAELQLKGFITGKITYNRTMYVSTQLGNDLLAAAITNTLENKQLSKVVAQLKADEKRFKNSITNSLFTK